MTLLPAAALTQCAVQAPATSAPPAVPSPRLYGTPSYMTGTPFKAPGDDFYSGANSHPHDLDHWYGNGYDW